MPNRSMSAIARRGTARLSAKFREAPQDRYALAKWEDWSARTEAVVAK